tara:strand:- start:6759 stop:8414 length:1656 start_codon:yes stop_codon:yes gene_type:complete
MEDRAFGVAFSWDDQQTFIRNTEFGKEHIGKLISEIYKSKKTVVMHNAEFDLHMIRETYDVQAFPNQIIDTLRVAHLLDSAADHTLKGWGANVYGNGAAYWESLLDEYKKKYKVKNYEMFPPEILDPYAGHDAFLTNQLAYKFVPQVMTSYGRLFDLEHALIPCILDMEKEGIALDLDFIDQQSQTLGLRKRELERQLFSTVGKVINPASPKQLGDYLYGELGLEIPFRNEGKHDEDGEWVQGSPKTDEKALNLLDHPIVDIIKEWRKVNKNLSTYFSPYQKLQYKGRIHPRWNACGPRTGRMSSSNPNLQNIPKDKIARRMFVPDSEFIAIDWSQIELRMLAHVANESAMKDAIASEVDLHSLTASKIYGVSIEQVTSTQRSIAKTVNFAIIYGAGQDKLADTINDNPEANVTVEEAREYMDGYWSGFPDANKFKYKVKNQGENQGYVNTIFGRRLTLSKAHAAINYIVQGSSGDLMKIALVRCWKYAKANGGSIRNTIHDELVFDNLDPQEHTPNLVQLMQNFKLSVPVVANPSVSKKSWGDIEEWQPT